MKTIVFSLSSPDPLAALSGVVVVGPLTPNSQVVSNGFIKLTNALLDSVKLVTGNHVLAFNLFGLGGPVTVALKIGDNTIATTTVNPASHGFVHHSLPFAVP